MNHSNKHYSFISTILMFVFCLSAKQSFCQSWQSTSPDILYGQDASENAANVKVGIGTATPTEKLDVVGNLKVSGFIDADSIHCRTLKIGHSLIFSDIGPLPFNHQEAASSDGRMTLERVAFNPITGLPQDRDDIRFGIGWFPSGATPGIWAKLHLNNSKVPAVAVDQLFTNSFTGQGGTDGFKLSIFPDATAQLSQQEPSKHILINMATNNNTSNVGIGVAGFTTPARKLDVFDNGTGTAGGRPQLRLTQTSASVFTDFQTTALGDLYINPRSGANNRNVGVNTSAPINTFEVKSGVGSGTLSPTSSLSPTRSGVRLSALTSLMNPDAATNAGVGHPSATVLSVNETGDIILVKDGGTTGATGATGAAGATGATGPAGAGVSDFCASSAGVNYIIKQTSTVDPKLCTSSIWENSIADHFVGIGTIVPDAKLHIVGTGSAVSTSPLSVQNSAGDRLLHMKNDGRIGFGDASNTTAKFTFRNTISSLGIYDRAIDIFHIGSSNQPAVAIDCDANSNPNVVGLSVNTYSLGATNATGGAISARGNCYFGTNNPLVGGAGMSNNMQVKVISDYNKQFGMNIVQEGNPGNTVQTPASIGLYVENGGFGTECCGANPQYTVGAYVKMTSPNNTAQGSKCAVRIDAGDSTQYGLVVEQGRVSINNGPTSPWTVSGVNYHLYLNGNAFKTSGGGPWSGPSDIRVKTDTALFTDGMAVLRNIRPMSYAYNGKAGTIEGTQGIGVIAQQIVGVAPYTITPYEALLEPTDSTPTSLYAYNSGPLLYVAINAIKQLDSIVQVQQFLLDSVFERLNMCCNSNARIASGNHDGNSAEGNDETHHIELASLEDVVLYQNEPNPFSTQTTIRYFIPERVKEAEMVFMDEFGREIKREAVGTGYGKIEAGTDKLSSGIYTYSLVVDGKITGTKKMIRTK